MLFRCALTVKARGQKGAESAEDEGVEKPLFYGGFRGDEVSFDRSFAENSHRICIFK